MDDIIKALGILTNGQITEVPNPVFGWEKLPSGYYFDNKNNQKDIRDWEIERYLTVDPMLEDKTAIECWVSKDNETNMFLLFPYSWGVIRCK